MAQNKFKILIVEDSLFNQAILRHILEMDQAGMPEDQRPIYEIATAQSGPEALEMILNDDPDLVLLDIILPGMSGFEILASLQMKIGWQAPSVIIISGLSDEEDEEKGLSLGAVDYIAKPFKQSIVLARIKTHLKIVEQMRIIEMHSMVDQLTGMPNRRGFDNQLAMEWGRAIRDKTHLSLLMVDVDRFKVFNDNYGHQQGDVALQTVSATIRAVLKRASDFGSRWGGEEFAILLPNTNLEGALHVAELLRESIEDTAVPSIGDHADLNVSVSIGAASVIPTRDHDVEAFIAQSDKALYAAKEGGRNRVCG